MVHTLASEPLKVTLASEKTKHRASKPSNRRAAKSMRSGSERGRGPLLRS